MKTLSVCMIVRNEEQNLSECLPMFNRFADEIIIIDHFSTDKSVQVAYSHYASVHQTRWIDDFSASRNLSLLHAKTDLVMWLDADDRVTPENAEQIVMLKQGIKRLNTAFGFQVKNILPDGGQDSFLQVRMWPNDKNVRYERRIHEQILYSLHKSSYNVMHFDGIIIEHHGYRNPMLSREKMKRNKRIIEMELPEYGHEPSFLCSYADAFNKLEMYDEAIDVYIDVINIRNSRQIHSEIYKYALASIVFCNMQKKEYTKAVEFAEQICKERNLATPHLLFMMAELYNKTGQPDLSRAYCYKVLDLEEIILSTAVNYRAIKSEAHKILNEMERTR